MELCFRKCTLDDTKALQLLARQTFFETFAEMNTPENMAAYIDSTFAEEQLRGELKNVHSAFYFLYADAVLVGYLKLNTDSAQTDVQDPDALEIERIYVAKAFQGAGLGGYFIDRAVEIARAQQKSRIWLGVWERNEKALRFYEKHGFRRFGAHTFTIGDDRQTDYLLHKAL